TMKSRRPTGVGSSKRLRISGSRDSGSKDAFIFLSLSTKRMLLIRPASRSSARPREPSNQNAIDQRVPDASRNFDTQQRRVLPLALERRSIDDPVGRGIENANIGGMTDGKRARFDAKQRRRRLGNFCQGRGKSDAF